jgi:hypothetical protein
VFLNGTPFDAFLGHSSEPGMQRVDVGDASEEMDSQRIVVGVPVEKKLLEWASIPSPVITPNDDGHNDEIVFSFTVLKINVPRPLRVLIRDLNRRTIREFREEPISSGTYEVAWDGRDDGGARVLPGLYLGQVCVDGAEDEAVLNRMIAVVY